jgi:hypothetical protein
MTDKTSDAPEEEPGEDEEEPKSPPKLLDFNEDTFDAIFETIQRIGMQTIENQQILRSLYTTVSNLELAFAELHAAATKDRQRLDRLEGGSKDMGEE